MKRITSLMLAAVMSALLIPQTVLASTTVTVTRPTSSYSNLKMNFIEGDVQKVDYSIQGAGTAINGSVDYTVTDENDAVIWSKSESISLQASETKNVNAILTVEKFGVHTLTIDVKDSIGNTVGTLSLPISVSRRMRERNRNLGLSTHFVFDAGYHPTLPLLKNLGVGFVRDEMYWNDYEAQEDKFVMKDYWNTYINECIKEGIEPLIILNKGNSIHTGGSGDNNFPDTKTELEAYYNYVYNLVSDLKGRVKYFEVWNEPNKTNMSGSQYAEILKTAYQAAKAANPDAVIVGLALAGAPNTFISDASSAKDYTDITSLHHYNNDGTKPANVDSASSDGHAAVTKQNTERLKNSFSGKSVWMTETGYAKGQNELSEKDAAAYTVRTALLNEHLGYVEKTFIYTWATTTDVDWGLLNKNLSPKDGLVAVTALNSFIGGKEFIDRTDSGKNFAYKYKKTGEEVLVLYNGDDTEGSMTVTPAYPYNSLYDMYGNPISLTGNGSYTVQTGKYPVYLVSRQTDAGSVMNYTQNRADVYGRIEGIKKGEQLMVYVLNEGKTINISTPMDIFTSGTLLYMNQASANADGMYEFNFPIKGDTGEYKIYIGYKGANSLIGPVTLDVDRFLTASLGASSKGTEITALADIKAAEGPIRFKATVDNRRNLTENLSLYAAGYNGTKMLWTNLIDKSVSDARVYEFTVEAKAEQSSECDSVKIFLWTDDIVPIVDEKEFK